jgi:hypothetical protein
MGEYHGPDRRAESVETMVARIDERVYAMSQAMEKLATVERVQSLENDFMAHKENHKWGLGTSLAALTGGGALVTSIIALFSSKGHP